MKTLPISPTDILQQPLQTSRTVVIGVGDFGLQVVSLLLPRLEVHYRFVADAKRKLITHCGLVMPDKNGQSQYRTINRSVQAFTNVRQIQHTILLGNRLSATQVSQKLLPLLGIASPKGWLSAPGFWLESLIRPILADEWNYTSHFVHLHLYVIASAQQELLNEIHNLAEVLVRLDAPVTFNLIMNVNATDTPFDPTLQHTQAVIRQLKHDPLPSQMQPRIYLLHHSKKNQALTKSPGEAAMAVCNFIDALVFSRLGDTLAEKGLPDSQELLRFAPYSTLGAAKLYVPIAEISSELLDRFVCQKIRSSLQPEPPANQLKKEMQRDEGELEFTHLCQLALSKLPIQIMPRQKARVWPWTRIMRFLRRNREDQEAATRDKLMRQLPHLRLSRRFWQNYRRQHGRWRSIEVWWRALVEFEQQVLTKKLPEWEEVAAKKLGVSSADEQLVRQLAQALRSEPIAQEVQYGSPEERADKLEEWIALKRPLSPAPQKLKQAVAQELFNKPDVNAPTVPQVLPDWLGRWLQADRTGYLPSLSTRLTQQIAAWLANDPTGLKLAEARLKGMQNRFKSAQEALQAWKDEQSGSLTPSQNIRQEAREEGKKRLIKAMRSQPYPSALLVRLLIPWLLPIFIVASGMLEEQWTLPPPWDTRLTQVIILWSLLWLLFYLLILAISKMRIWRAQRQIEQIVLEDIDRTMEQRIYGGSEANQTGLMEAYLQAFERQFVARAPEDGLDLPSSQLATVQGTLKNLKEARPAQVSTVPDCVVYRSIGDEMTRSLLRAQLKGKLSNIPNLWELDSEEIVLQMTSAPTLSEHLKQALHTLIWQQYEGVVRSQSIMKLPTILQQPENQHLTAPMLLDDLNWRAKPLSAHEPQHSAQTRETLTYISTDVKAMTTLLEKLRNQGPRLFINPSCDPFGLNVIKIVNGITWDSLPFRKNKSP